MKKLIWLLTALTSLLLFQNCGDDMVAEDVIIVNPDDNNDDPINENDDEETKTSTYQIIDPIGLNTSIEVIHFLFKDGSTDISIKHIKNNEYYEINRGENLQGLFTTVKPVVIKGSNRYFLMYLYKQENLVSIVEYSKNKDRFKLVYLDKINSSTSRKDLKNFKFKRINQKNVLFFSNSRLVENQNDWLKKISNSSCKINKNLDSNNCTGVARACDDKKGIGISKFNLLKMKWRECNYTTCKEGFFKKNNTCIPKPECPKNQVKINGSCKSPTKDCTSGGGHGIKEWKPKEKKWSACKIKGCLPGFRESGKSCKRTSSSLKKNNVSHVKELHSKSLFKENFSRSKLIDFNGDKVADKVSCSGRTISITDGSSSNKVLYKHIFKSKSSDRIFQLSKCDSVLFGKTPAVLIGSFYRNQNHSKRYNDQQKVLFNDNGKYRIKTLRFKDGAPYLSVARSVRCTKYSSETVFRRTGKRFRDGQLCFYPSYPSADTGKGTTGLFKIEKRNNNKFVIIDLSSHKGFPWRGREGLRNIGRKWFCWFDVRYEGAYMMDGTFMKRKNSAMKTLITVGQHSHIRKIELFIDKNSPQGVGMSSDVIYSTGCNKHSEFLSITSFDTIDKDIKPRCAYVTGEVGRNAGNFVHTHSRLLCEEQDGSWTLKELPVKVNSLYSEGTVRLINGEIVVRSLAHTDDGKYLGSIFHKINKDYFKGIKRNR